MDLPRFSTDGGGITSTLEEQSHPLEALYRARDALQEAALGQRQADLAKQDLPSYGWTLRSVLDNLGELAHVLGDQVDNIDRDRLYREALSNHPYEVIDSAVDHLLELRRAPLLRPSVRPRSTDLTSNASTRTSAMRSDDLTKRYRFVAGARFVHGDRR